MQLIFVEDDVERELDVQSHQPDATVQDLLRALCPGASPEARLMVGGRVAGPELGLDEVGLHDGATVRLGRVPPAPAPPGGPAELRVIAGPQAGRVVTLQPGTHTVGRAGSAVDLADPTVSRRHCTLVVSPLGECQAEDLGSLNGTWLDGDQLFGTRSVPSGSVLRFGDVPCVIGRPQGGDRPAALDGLRFAGPSGAIPFNRPPRVLTPARLESELVLPSPPAGRTSSPFNLISMVAPLVFGVAMALLVDPQDA